MNIAAALSSGAEVLRDAGIAEHRREVSSLLAFVLQEDAAFLIAHPEFELSEELVVALGHVIERRAAHEPFQYITGRQEFWGLEFEVTPDVLVPRPETEILVERAIALLSTIERPRILEVGVGSGCISVSILHSLQNATAVGTDISTAALRIAAGNAVRHNVDKRIVLHEGDLFASVAGRFDVAVSNPPYVPDAQIGSLQAEVRGFEPRVALSGGVDGMEIIRRIVARAPQVLVPGGSLLLEIGFDQVSRVTPLFEPMVWAQIEVFPDLQGIPRIVRSKIR